MCGIAGFYSFQGNINRERFETMVDIIEYRGPDDRGVFYYNNLALGHRRLSIIDLSEDGHQPFGYKDRYVVVYNGEIYNYKELRKELIEKGYYFKTKTDTEVLAAAYDCYGKECVHHFNGMWSFAILDKEKNQLYCARDRFGIKPFYYYLDDTQFVFGSEIKQILCMIDQKPVANRKRLLEFLVYGDLDHTDDTMFRDIKQLRGGYEITMDLEKHDFKLNRYYDLSNRRKRITRYKDCCDQFRKDFKTAVSLRLRADVPVGYCLSGGLDSSSIVCMANAIVENRGQEVEQHAVSSCFEDKAYDEQEYIDEVIKHTNIYSHRVYPDGGKVFDEVDKLIWHMDEPFGSTSMYAQWNVFREAHRNGLTVMLDGQGADEQLAGYSEFYEVAFANLLKHFRIRTFIKELHAYKKLRASTEKHKSSTKKIVMSITNAFMPKWMYAAISSVYRVSRKSPFTREQLEEAHQNRDIYPINNMEQYLTDSIQCGMQALLHYEDRNSMAFSIESRVPFLDCKLVETIAAIPFEYKIRNGVTKVVLRDALRAILPEKIRNRYSKLGFVTPEDKWINENYEQYRRELENACDVLSAVVDKERVLRWFDSKGKISRGDFMLWRIICAGRWAKIFQVSVE